MRKNQTERRRVKGEIAPEFLSFLYWLKVTSETKAREDGTFGDWRAHVKYAALLITSAIPSNRELTLEIMRVIGFQALSKNKKFFINLGKRLSDKTNHKLLDKLDVDLAEIVLFHPDLSARNAVRELAKRGHTRFNEASFGMRKKRLLDAKKEYDAIQTDAAYDIAHGK